jgi:archaellum component FlaC|tara:strand:- start:206 stop:412 length:207 start_codon:yes stop_codon:yes gene_type:complete
MSETNTKEVKEQLERIEKKVENLSDMVQGLYAKIDSMENKLSKHIDFIDETYEGLRNPIKLASKFFNR